MTVAEDPEVRLRRLRMRSWRRGMKECDLILGGYADRALAGLGAAELTLYESLLGESDQDILAWVTGAAETPERYRGLIAQIDPGGLRRA